MLSHSDDRSRASTGSLEDASGSHPDPSHQSLTADHLPPPTSHHLHPTSHHPRQRVILFSSLTAAMPKPTSLPRVCIALGFPDAQKLMEHARLEADAGESFFEFRLDYLASPESGIGAIRKFLASRSDCSILATCRRHQSDGQYNGSAQEPIRVLDA